MVVSAMVAGVAGTALRADDQGGETARHAGGDEDDDDVASTQAHGRGSGDGHVVGDAVARVHPRRPASSGKAGVREPSAVSRAARSAGDRAIRVPCGGSVAGSEPAVNAATVILPRRLPRSTLRR